MGDQVSSIEIKGGVESFPTAAMVKLIYEWLGCKEPLSKVFIRMALSDMALFDFKQGDRGPGNIAAFGERGVVMRLADKHSRLKTIVWDGKEPRLSEPVENEYADMSVYPIIARLVRAGWWPGCERDPKTVYPKDPESFEPRIVKGEVVRK